MPQPEQAYLAGGCFWCLDAAYRQIQGIEDVISGYAGGDIVGPTYEQVCGGDTGHAEIVEVVYDPEVINYKDILDIFFTIHNPTTLNRQGNDVGSQYRSAIFYTNDQQKIAAEKAKAEVAKLWSDPVVTQIVPLDKFYRAEEYHQNYFAKNPTQGYCQAVINPKLAKLREKFTSRLKPGLKY